MVNRIVYPVTNTLGNVFNCELIEVDKEAEKIAVLFPGAGYNTKMPILYYATSLLVENGYNVLHLNYDFSRKEYSSLSLEEYLGCLKKDVASALDHILPHYKDRQFTLVGKSLGTVAIASELEYRKEFHDSKIVWLTPLIHNEEVYERMMKTTHSSLAIIGSEDSVYRKERWTSLQEKENFETILIEGADHGLDRLRDVFGSIEAIKQSIRSIRNFIKEEK